MKQKPTLRYKVDNPFEPGRIDMPAREKESEARSDFFNAVEHGEVPSGQYGMVFVIDNPTGRVDE